MNILFIEDEEAARLGLVSVLEKAGYNVDLAETANAAIEKMKAKKYDLILLDVMILPVDVWQDVRFRETGKVLLSKIRKRELGELKTDKNVPIIAITAVSDVDVHLFINGFRNTHVLPKPIDPEDALGEIKQFFRGIEDVQD